MKKKNYDNKIARRERMRLTRLRKRALAVMLSLVLTLSLLPLSLLFTPPAKAAPLTPEQRLRAAAGGTPYSSDPNWNSSTQTYKLTHDFTGETGAEPILTAQLDILVDFTLDLNGYTLTIEAPASPTNTNGIKIASDITLIIEDTSISSIGELNVTVTYGGASGYGAAINTTDGALVMVAGTVNATGVTGGAGIGGGAARSGGTIIINGGTVNAKGGGGASGGAGIGGGGNGGGSGGLITINGGTVNATGGASGAGIGGGGHGDGGSITITGGTITAAGGGSGAGIGGGVYGDGGSITIIGGNITAVAGSAAPSAIGNGTDGTEGTVTITGTYNYWVNTIITQPATQTGSGTFANSSSYRYVKLISSYPDPDPDPDPDPSPDPYTPGTYTPDPYTQSNPPYGQKSTTPTNPTSNDSVVLVDGRETSAGELTVEGDKTIVTVDQDVLNDEIDNANDSVTVIVPVGEDTGTAEVQFVLKNVEDMAQKEMTFTLVVGNVQYDMPATAVDAAAVLAALGAEDPAQVPVSIAITTDVGAEKQAFVREAVDGSGMELVLPPIEFTITATYNGHTVEVTGFTQFVSRTVELTEEQAKQITTAVVIEPDGTARHVPTNVYEKDGKWYASVSSLTNSTYALIYQEKTFDDTEDKWFEAIVSEMGSRGIIAGIGNGLFDGERAITRAEFITIVVRALGLSEIENSEFEIQNSEFSDVLPGDWYFGAVAAACKYGLAGGVGGGAFAPERPITREEAMVILWKAAKLAGYEGLMGSLDGYADAGSVSAWAVDAARWNTGSDMITDSGGMLDPQGSISRAEAAMYVLRLLQKAELVDNRSSVEDVVPGDLLNAEPRKKPEVIQMPGGGDEETPNPGDDNYMLGINTGAGAAGDIQEIIGTGVAQGLIGSGGGQMTPQEAIRELNTLLAMCQADPLS